MPNELTQTGSGNFGFQDIHDSNFNIYLGKTLEYKQMCSELATQQELLSYLPEDQTEKRLRASHRIEELKAQILQFKQNVLQLAQEFDRIEINTDRLRRAKEYFEQGKIAESRAVFDDEREQMQDENNRLIKQKENYENNVLPELKKSSEEFYLRALLERTAYDNPNWLDDTCDYFERSINAYATEENLFEYALFLQNHNRFDQAEQQYEKYLAEFAQSDVNKRAMTLNNLGLLHQAKNELAQAETEYLEALEIRRKLAAVNPAAYLPYLANTLANFAGYYQKNAANRERSVAYAIEAVSILQPIVEDLPYTQNYFDYAMWVLQEGWNLREAEIQQLLAAQMAK